LLNGIIVESTLYHYETISADEAFYLASLLNSSILDELIKPMQSKGEFGERDIHKKPLEYPIPRYRPEDPVHKNCPSWAGKPPESRSGRCPASSKSMATIRGLRRGARSYPRRSRPCGGA